MDVEWAKLLVTLATGFVAAGWAVLQWRSQRRKDRHAERKRLATKYVNPFLFACEDLQSRLYNILCYRGLHALRNPAYKVDADYQYAEETLYLVAQYFAYEPFILRYTPYGTDPRVIGLIQQVRAEFASDSEGVDDWCIFRPRQKALGQLVLSFRQGEQGTDVDTVSLLQFEDELSKDGAVKSLHLEQALHNLNNAEQVSDLHGGSRFRLARVQSYLVDLIEYLEGELAGLRREELPRRKRTAEEPFSLFQGKGPRKRAYDSACEKCVEVDKTWLGTSTPRRPTGHGNHECHPPHAAHSLRSDLSSIVTPPSAG